MSDTLKLAQTLLNSMKHKRPNDDLIGTVKEARQLAAAYIDLHDRMDKIAVAIISESIPHDEYCDYICSITERDQRGRRVPVRDCTCFKARIFALAKGTK